MKLRLIGDAHGRYSKYIELAKEADYSIQIGDLGFNYSCMTELDPNHHFVLGGNHDNYEIVNEKFILQTPHFLGDFGTHSVLGYDIFFVRGGNSIDKQYRKHGRDWWPDEELSYLKCKQALEEYEKSKPDFVISHECPVSIIKFVSGRMLWDGLPIQPSKTANLLQQMLEVHRPKTWIFGHHHVKWTKEIDGTKFSCLPELGYVDLEQKTQ